MSESSSAERTSNYLLGAGSAELEWLTLQARVWEPEAEVMLDRIGVQSGWSSLDLGCGALGILGPLAKRVGSSGRVVGVDNDPRQLVAARALIDERTLSNVEVLNADAYGTGLPDNSFDLVHVRFVFAPAAHDEQLLSEMLRLVRPGGMVAIQEPDSCAWQCFPPHEAWDRLKTAILRAFKVGGGDFDAGQRIYGMLREAGCQDLRTRAATIALQDRHPYMRLPIQFATSLRQRILGNGLLSEAELNEALAACEQIAADAAILVLSFTVVQVWGRKPRAIQFSINSRTA